MSDYSQHPYRDLLEFIDNGCKQLGEERDFAQILLSMEKAESIEQLIKIYNNIFKLLAAAFFGTRKLPHDWHRPELWGYRHGKLAVDLNDYLNINILKWYNSQQEPSYEQCMCCLANLHESHNVDTIGEELYKKITPNVENEDNEILYVRSRHYALRKELEKYCTNRTVKKGEYISCSKYLAAHGRIFDVSEITFGKYQHITYENFVDDYKKELVIRNKQRAEETKNFRVEKGKAFLTNVGFILITIPIVLGMLFILNSLGPLITFPIGFYLLGIFLLAL